MPKSLNSKIVFVAESHRKEIETTLEYNKSKVVLDLDAQINGNNLTEATVAINRADGDVNSLTVSENTIYVEKLDPNDETIEYPIRVSSFLVNVVPFLPDPETFCKKIDTINDSLQNNMQDFKVFLRIDVIATGRRKKSKSTNYMFLIDYDVNGFYSFYEDTEIRGEMFNSLIKVNFKSVSYNEIDNTFFIYFKDANEGIFKQTDDLVLQYPYDEVKLSNKTFKLAHKSGCLTASGVGCKRVEQAEDVEVTIESSTDSEQPLESKGIMRSIRKILGV